MDTTEAQCDTFETGEVNVNEFQRAAEPAVIDGVTQPEDPNDNRDISPK